MRVTQFRPYLVYGLAAAWWVSLSAVLIGLMVAHERPLTVAAVGRPVATPAAAGSWTMTHVLVADCPCSRAVAEHLGSATPIENVVQRVLLLGDDSAIDADRRGGLTVTRGPAAEADAATLGVTGGPVLVIQDPLGVVRYRGGYMAVRPGTIAARGQAFAERELLDRLQHNEPVAAFPAFGCDAGPNGTGFSILRRNKDL